MKTYAIIVMFLIIFEKIITEQFIQSILDNYSNTYELVSKVNENIDINKQK